MNPRDYELRVARHFADAGFDAEVTSYQADYGVDVFATRGNQKIAIQAKMFGRTSRPINRAMVMELHGAAAYFDCTSAVIATDGDVLPDAIKVAKKLGISIVHIPADAPITHPGDPARLRPPGGKMETFESIWEEYIMPLQGRTLLREDGSSNNIVRVDWSGIERITSNERRQHIKIEIFRRTINHLLLHGSITRTQINNEYAGRASSGIVLILSQVPAFEITTNPTGLRYVPANLAAPSPSY